MVSAGEVGKQTELKLYYTSLLSKRHNQSRRDCMGKPNPPPPQGHILQHKFICILIK
jgi:hypothetical protein